MALGFLKKYDLYIKPHEDFQIKTAQGGLVTLLAIGLTTTLFLMELSLLLTPEIISDMRVDKSRSASLNITLDITFHKAPCDALTFSVIDVSGMSHANIDHSLGKQRLQENGSPINEEAEPVIIKSATSVNVTQPAADGDGVDKTCKSCYGAESMAIPCCRTCDEVKQAYRIKGWKLIEEDKIEQCVAENPGLLDSWASKVRKAIRDKQGCRLHGHLNVNRVAGTIYAAPGHDVVDNDGSMVHKFPGMGGSAIAEFINSVDFSHTVGTVHFGEHKLADQENPLDGKSVDGGAKGHYKSVKHTYFLKIVPSTFEKLNGEVVNAAQYSMTEHGSSSLGNSRLPGVWLDYQISPMVIRYKERQRSMTHFFTNICAIVGGIFAVAGLLDSTVYRSMKLWRKQQLGKD